MKVSRSTRRRAKKYKTIRRGTSTGGMSMARHRASTGQYPPAGKHTGKTGKQNKKRKVRTARNGPHRNKYGEGPVPQEAMPGVPRCRRRR